MATIRTLRGTPILDSRGEWTLEVVLELTNGARFTASVPHGKSTGSHEVFSLSTPKAAANVARIAKNLKGLDPRKQEIVDNMLLELDGTPEKKRLGGNTLLGISTATARAGAHVNHIPLWKHIRNFSGARGAFRFPRLFVNVINGGLHAGNNLPFQEYLVIPNTTNIRTAITTSTEVYQKLKEILVRAKGQNAANVGDEGGFAPNFKNPLEPLECILRAARAVEKHSAIQVGLDAAATDVKLSSEKLFSLYRAMIKQFPLTYLEDPFGEEQFAKFAALRSIAGAHVLIAGDDLTTTNTTRMRIARAAGSVNAVIVKPNQIGTVSEAIHAVRLAHTYGWSVVASHRSGETNDSFIADFAVGVRADGLKLGAPARGERITKYNRLLEIEREQ